MIVAILIIFFEVTEFSDPFFVFSYQDCEHYKQFKMFSIKCYI